MMEPHRSDYILPRVTPNPQPASSPACPSCGRAFRAGATWAGANYCRGLALLGFIQQNPGKSAWELSQVSGMPYVAATRGLAKLREHEVVSIEAEERVQGGFRYRYWPAGGDVARYFIESVRLAEGLNRRWPS
jgi:hypothetical protein